MTHRWGFDLSMTAVRLMRREAGHWHEIASESLEDGDVDQRLRKLVEQVPTPRIVDIFLPQDQILYTEVEISDPDSAVAEIEASMNGRTPYSLSELEIDWEIGSGNVARVAAIAKVTLSEAEAFADQCGLGVSRFTSLPDAEDFPRQPDFGIGAAGDDREETAAAPEGGDPAFTSARIDDVVEDTAVATADESPTPPEPIPDASPEPAPEPALADAAEDSTPVVRVEDAAPVMQLSEEREKPLDPGPALPRTAGAPRVRTDLTLPDGGGRAAASLTPPEPIDPYGRAEKEPAQRMRGLGLGLAAVLTAGIGLVVWSIFPDTSTEPESAANVPQETAIAAAPPALSEVPPSAQVEFTAAPTAPAIVEDVRVAFEPLDVGPDAKVASLLGAPIAQSEARPAALLPPDTPADAWLDAPAILASLTSIPDESGILFKAPVPPVTRPGNVGLPGVQGFEPGLAPLSGQAPEYVPPRPPAIAEENTAVPETVEEPVQTVDTTTPDALDTDIVAPDTEIAALDETILAEPELPLASPETPPEGPTEDPTASEQEAEPELPTESMASELPAATELALTLTDVRTRARPSDFVLEIERQTFGGRTEAELSQIRPPERPASAQAVAESERGTSQPSALAVATSPDPRGRPDDMGDIIARAIALERERRIAALPTANTTDAVRAALGQDEPEEATTNPRNSPRLAIPSNTDVARQATIEDALRLNRLNLVGVFGAPADRRALVRLPTGRYVKVKIGDQIDGGTIAAISEDALQYRKGGRVFQLQMPQG